jgi:hypothetical protein
LRLPLLPDLAHPLLGVALVREEDFDFLLDIMQSEANPFDFSLLEVGLHLDVIPFLLDGVEFVAGLLLLIIGAVEQFSFNEVEVYLLVFVLPLLLDSGVAFKALEALCLEGPH